METLPTTQGASQPKRRRLRACDRCRQRKIRCDNTPGSCRNCQIYGDRCAITRDGRSMPRAKRPPPRSCINRLKGSASANQGQHDPTVSPLGQPSPVAYSQSPNSDLDHLTGTSSRGSAFSSPNEGTELLPNTSTPDVHLPQLPELSPTKPSSASVGTLQGVITTEVGTFPKNSKFAGMSSPQVYAKSVEELFKSTAPHINVMAFFCPMMTFAEELPLRSPDYRSLVDKSTADRFAVQGFFNSYQVLFPIFDWKVFSASYESFYQTGRTCDPALACSIFLVIALGSDDNVDVCDSHFQAACSLYGDLVARPYMSSVQSLILMTLHLINTGRDGQALLTIGIATRIAQSIGLHRSLSTHYHPHELQIVLREHTVRNCVWWLCYCLDKKLSFEMGRPSAINDADCDADLPDLSQACTPTTQPEGPCLPSFFLALIDLCKRISRISSNLFNIKTPQLDGNTLTERIRNADTLLEDWRSSLPRNLVSNRNVFGSNFELEAVAAPLLNSMYLNTLVIIHRSSLIATCRIDHITRPSCCRMAASEKICLDAAHTLAHEVNMLITEPRTVAAPRLVDLGSCYSESLSHVPSRWIHPYAINAAMTIFISLMKGPRKWFRDVDIALLRSMHHCFRNPDDVGLLSRFENLLESLIHAVELSTANQHGDHVLSPQRALGESATNVHSRPKAGEEWARTIEDPTSSPRPTTRLPRNSTASSNQEFSLDDLFGDMSYLWGFQLWPLAPLDDENVFHANGVFSSL
ncbi:hypothetical protein BO78DRAFT_422282 [Aspergillus sclerotiicarbonarius CBS 121057]|uniref:Zn(2)-C6 fungal-type domain-containing protein n=1 Tax=Aspergillus sclerotiicarbonarius (strain CBS 121057 / IBT 28362) TaxID=1448318 RepID=A0A319E7Z9_ASPSB|nr:hypothetical protein BO78DRAFT_422282 [Aspergillus sclerotiicarbonarius CBS 121057]